MRQYLDGVDLFNEAMLTRAAVATPILIVEGGSDYNLALHYLGAGLELIVGLGKPKMLDAAALLDAADIADIRLLVDHDFDGATGADSRYPSNVFYTSDYDLLMDLHHRNEQIAVRVGRRYCNSEQDAELSVEAAYDSASIIGYLRFCSESNGLNLTMSNFPVHMIAPHKVPAATAVATAADLARKRSTSPPISTEGLLDLYEAAKTSNPATAVVNSHDFLASLGHYCRMQSSSAAVNKFEELYELAVDSVDFYALPVVKTIQGWVGTLSTAA